MLFQSKGWKTDAIKTNLDKVMHYLSLGEEQNALNKLNDIFIDIAKNFAKRFRLEN